MNKLFYYTSIAKRLLNAYLPIIKIYIEIYTIVKKNTKKNSNLKSLF